MSDKSQMPQEPETESGDIAAIPDSTSAKRNKKYWYNRLPRWVYPVALGTAAVSTVGLVEMETSVIQSAVFNAAAQGNLFTSNKTINDKTAPMAQGPYDVRHGYNRTLDIRKRITDRGYQIDGTTTWQDRSVFGIGLFPIYDEKQQIGLSITDQQGRILHDARFPRNVYKTYADMPPLLVKSLLLVENRELMDTSLPARNPAIEWERLFFAVQQDLTGQGSAGGSTLATQTEKFRHSPGGNTSGDKVEKFRQMITASIRAYQYGFDTTQARQDIVLDYINSIPLSAVPGFGEVHGFSDGLRAWFGKDPARVNELLMMDDKDLDEATLREKAIAYRETLSIVMAVKQPTTYFRRKPELLEKRIDVFLPLLAEQGIITPRLRDAALQERVTYADHAQIRERYKVKPDPQKAISSMQIDMMNMLGINSLYELERYDIKAKTTLDVAVDRAISKKLYDVKDPEIAAQYGLTGYRLVGSNLTDDVVYTFTMYERLPNGQNVLRVQADNMKGQFNLNEDSKLELGSTAKLRTMVSYLEAISELHARFSKMSTAERETIAVNKDDNLTRFVISYLNNDANDKSLNAILEAALDRTYSATPREFWTGGGLHTPHNFDNKYNGANVSVKTALHKSLNLPFVRIMQDIVYYTIYQKKQVDTEVFTNPDSETRRAYLEKFASFEGKTYLWRGWEKLEDRSQAGLLKSLADDAGRSPYPRSHKLGNIYRSLHPYGSMQAMEKYIKDNCAGCSDNLNVEKIYETYAPGKFNLKDRGYISGLHPLTLWLGEYLTKNPEAKWSEAVEASAQERIDVYEWLYQSKDFNGQNGRIYTIIEREAFNEFIQPSWADLGYPFSRMTTSYLSALGSSGDTPAALATLAGILQNDGLMVPSVKYTEINFGLNTPYESKFKPKDVSPVRVLPAEVAKLARREMQNVVELGTARRASGSVKLSDGTELPVGAKTGTGDNREGERVKNRTATFVYTIDDRFFGCVTAFVEGPNAAKYNFTSGLTAQLFKSVIAPELTPLLDRSYGVTPPKPAPEKVASAAPAQVKTSVKYRM